MKKKKHRQLLPIFIIVITLLYPLDPVCATAATTPDPQSIETGSLSNNTLSDEPIAVSDNTLSAAPTNIAPPETPDCISSAAELSEWLNAHMYSGGRARLTENITMDFSYLFIPYPNMPPLYVETDGCTIFVCADVELWSDGHLTFSGEGSTQGIFHVKKGGSLLLDGVTVEGPAEGDDSRYTLWQEEGASLTVGSTFAPGQVSGKIHYADTPFVTQADSVCVIVEQGQLLDTQLPVEITCRVNYQGTFLEHEPVSVSWDMTNTQRQQDERQRFQVQGVFSQAQSDINPVCTVVYNDYPLTFTRTDAFVRRSAYTFRGDYIKQENTSSAVVSPEYSFDGQNWIREGENNTLSADNGFYISFPCDQWDIELHPYIHIRLRADAEEQVYYSNVLRYTANNLDVEEDLGGSRGGGTAVVNPPDDCKAPPKPEASNNPAESNQSEQSDQSTDTDKPEQQDQTTDSEQPATAQNGADLAADVPTKNPGQSAESSAAPALAGGKDPSDSGKSQTGSVTAQSASVLHTPNHSAAEPPTDKAAVSPEENDDLCAETLLLATGFVLFSAAVGALCFFIHSGGTKR